MTPPSVPPSEKQGSALILAIIIVIIIGAFVAASFQLTTDIIIKDKRVARQTEAMSVADAGLELAWANWRYVVDKSGGTMPTQATLDDPTNSVNTYLTSANWTKVTTPDIYGGRTTFNWKTTGTQKISIQSVNAYEVPEGGSSLPAQVTTAMAGRPPGWYAFAQNYLVKSSVEVDAPGGTFSSSPNYGYSSSANKLTATVQRVFSRQIAPVFQAAVFFDDYLEISPGPTFDIRGLVHSNGDLCLLPAGTLNLWDNVTYSGTLYYKTWKPGVKDGGHTASGSNVQVADTSDPPKMTAYANNTGRVIGGQAKFLPYQEFNTSNGQAPLFDRTDDTFMKNESGTADYSNDKWTVNGTGTQLSSDVSRGTFASGGVTKNIYGKFGETLLVDEKNNNDDNPNNDSFHAIIEKAQDLDGDGKITAGTPVDTNNDGKISKAEMIAQGIDDNSKIADKRFYNKAGLHIEIEGGFPDTWDQIKKKTPIDQIVMEANTANPSQPRKVTFDVYNSVMDAWTNPKRSPLVNENDPATWSNLLVKAPSDTANNVPLATITEILQKVQSANGGVLPKPPTIKVTDKDGNAVPSSVRTAVVTNMSFNRRFYDIRNNANPPAESPTDTVVTNFDVGGFATAVNGNFSNVTGYDYNGIVYFADNRANPPLRADSSAGGNIVTTTDSPGGTAVNAEVQQKRVVRLSNGSVLPDKGFTFATVNPAYIVGDYNTGGTGTAVPSNTSSTTPDTAITKNVATGYTSKPSAVIADAVTILSSKWSRDYTDTTAAQAFNSYLDGAPVVPQVQRDNTTLAYTGALTSIATKSYRNTDMVDRVATPTTVNTAVVSGNVPSTNNTHSGGVHNFPRFLESWSGIRLTYVGSLVQLYWSEQANQPWGASKAYDPPNRVWGFDVNFRKAEALPPGSPDAVSFVRGSWRRTLN